MLNIHYEVETQFMYGWENVWHDDDDLVTFKTLEEAQLELNEYCLDMLDAFTQGHISEFNGGDYRIVKVTTTKELTPC